jgi:hypothetical protein
MPDNDLSQGFLYIDLQGLMPGKPFAGFAAGTFEDMLGREIILKADDIKDFVKNTLALIAEYKARKMPGLPIDARKHDKGDAAGWITGAEPGEVKNSKGETIPIIRLLAEWTRIGVELIQDKIAVNFSPTVDLNNKVIRGGSLTNWPATVDQNDVPLFSAVELSKGIYSFRSADMSESNNDIIEPVDTGTDLQTAVTEPAPIVTEPETAVIGDENMTIELSQEALDEMVNERVKSALAELDSQRPEPSANDLTDLARGLGLPVGEAEDAQIKHLEQLTELIQQQADLKWQRQLSEMQRRNRYSELAQRVTGGTAEAPRGFQTDPERLQAELMKLEPEQAKYWSGLLESTVKQGLLNFTELGHGRRVKPLKPIPAEAVNSLKAALENGHTADEFFELAGLGSAADYDLSAYEGGK